MLSSASTTSGGSDTVGPVMQFAELLSDSAVRLHVGCVLRSGKGWVEISLPRGLSLAAGGLLLRFHPHPQSFAVQTLWRRADAIGLEFLEPPPDWIAST
ncbi:hypothetical protein [Aestuariivirga sp.]|jgi:hypothetical protein|uniref:hypothetical protein n=1 Tax=Aestuariivirga sp. TaxID=2650926 RepID=UPI00378453E0